MIANALAQRQRKLLTHSYLQAYVHASLTQRWSPEQIARRLKAEYPDAPTMRVSHETIYTYVYVLPARCAQTRTAPGASAPTEGSASAAGQSGATRHHSHVAEH
jgi:IS30 family transposase